MRRAVTLAAVLALVVAFLAGCRSTSPPERGTGEHGLVRWNEWSPATFERARRENKLVLLHLGAVWCHWCHVMERTTYADEDVLALIDEAYVPIYVDQDARPDVSARYEDWGWPATVLFDADGTELAKLRGYVEPERFAALLAAFRDDPTPGPSAIAPAPPRLDRARALDPALRDELEQRRLSAYDDDNGGWGFVHKFLEPGNVELALVRAAEGDEREEALARGTLDGQLALLDPVWGGVYQYSHGGVWSNPHFEKIMPIQADNLRAYSLAYAQWGDERYRDAAAAIFRYLTTMLRSADGVFYVSQDADLVQGEHAEDYFDLPDAERRARGLPRIDTSLYARENGLAAEACCDYYAATGERPALAAAERAARWALAERALEGGGFAHGPRDAGGPFLADTLALGRAFTRLYQVTGERAWLDHAVRAAAFLDARLRPTDPDAPGFLTAVAAPGLAGPFAPVQKPDENVAAARWLNLLARYTGDERHAELARSSLRLAAASAADERSYATGALLLADLELAREPLHVTIVGPRDDASAAALFRAAQAIPARYKRVDWQVPGAEPLPNTKVEFPALERPAAFLCAQERCSLPVFEPNDLRPTAARF